MLTDIPTSLASRSGTSLILQLRKASCGWMETKKGCSAEIADPSSRRIISANAGTKSPILIISTRSCLKNRNSRLFLQKLEAAETWMFRPLLFHAAPFFNADFIRDCFAVHLPYTAAMIQKQQAPIQKPHGWYSALYIVQRGILEIPLFSQFQKIFSQISPRQGFSFDMLNL